MANDRLRYEKMMEQALRGVVRQALREVSERGLPGNHHFYITFRTEHPGVDIPEYLKTQYPDTMTIVMQHQYWGLEINDDRFSITLSFRKMHERLTVPFEAITAFADPSVNFALQFDVLGGQRKPDTGLRIAAQPGTARSGEGAPKMQAGGERPALPAATDAPSVPQETASDNVVTLDAFRKKS